LLDDENARAALGQHGREYAEATFDVAQVARKFEVIFQAIPGAKAGN
jgi:hypothetical protein